MNRNIGINGAGGEIGRNLLRQNEQRAPEEQVPITHLIEGYLTRDQMVELLRNDPVRGEFPVTVNTEGDDRILLGNKRLTIVRSNPDEMVNWKELDVWGVLESTGARVQEEMAEEHLTVGNAKKVLVTAPTKGDAGIAHTLIPGFNSEAYDPINHDVLTNESCTTKSAIHITKALNDKFGVRAISLATVHAETGKEKRDLFASMGLVDDLGRLGFNPQGTGAKGALAKLFPEIAISAKSYRVPTTDGSLSDITFKLKSRTSRRAVEECLGEAVSDDIWEIVDSIANSADLIGNPHDAVIAKDEIEVIDGNLVRLSAGYDNAFAPTRSALDAIDIMRKAS